MGIGHELFRPPLAAARETIGLEERLSHSVYPIWSTWKERVGGRDWKHLGAAVSIDQKMGTRPSEGLRQPLRSQAALASILALLPCC